MGFLEEIRAAESFESLPRARRNLVFYSEGAAYWPYFRGVIRQLTEKHKCPFVYLTSSEDDPGLKLGSPLATGYFIGSAGPRKNLLETIEADILVMTMPDIGNLTIKKSSRCKNYVYVFHSPVSTHMAYLEGAFDNYDTIFCVGPYHEAEIRERESALGLTRKTLFAHGYGRLDDIFANAPAGPRGRRSKPATVLVAPTWGENGLLETLGEELIGVLLNAGFRVIARPHPQSMRLYGKQVKQWADRFQDQERFELETDMSATRSFYDSDVMISDWSGASLDFAFGLLKPVIFIDTPRKMRNPKFRDLGIEPYEAAIREKISRIVDPKQLETLPALIERILASGEDQTDLLKRERERSIYNLGRSAEVGSEKLAEMAFGVSAGLNSGREGLDEAALQSVLALLKAVAPRDGPPLGDVVVFLDQFLSSDARPSPEDVLRLENLCRAVDVLKSVKRDFDENFRNAKSDTELEINALPALVYAYTKAAAELSSADRGRALKFLNSAGKALDMYVKKGGVATATILESLLHRRYEAMSVRTYE